MSLDELIKLDKTKQKKNKLGKKNLKGVSGRFLHTKLANKKANLSHAKNNRRHTGHKITGKNQKSYLLKKNRTYTNRHIRNQAKHLKGSLFERNTKKFGLVKVKASQFRTARNNMLKRGKTLSLTAAPASASTSVNKTALKKLKVRNIDDKTVTQQDLQKLFEKQGTLVKAVFDKNAQG